MKKLVIQKERVNFVSTFESDKKPVSSRPSDNLLGAPYGQFERGREIEIEL